MALASQADAKTRVLSEQCTRWNFGWPYLIDANRMAAQIVLHRDLLTARQMVTFSAACKVTAPLRRA